MDRQKRLVSVLVMVATSATLAQAPAVADTLVSRNRRDWRVQQGQAFEAAFAQDLLFRLEPETHPNNPGGWTIQITPASDLQSDYLMVATPPYRFSNPRYVNTGYGITAEAALSWAHREFAFVAEAHDYDTAREALSVLLWSGTHTPDEVVRAQAAMEEFAHLSGFVLDRRWRDDHQTRNGLWERSTGSDFVLNSAFLSAWASRRGFGPT